jgi:hypothetical protein
MVTGGIVHQSGFPPLLRCRRWASAVIFVYIGRASRTLHRSIAPGLDGWQAALARPVGQPKAGIGVSVSNATEARLLSRHPPRPWHKRQIEAPGY